MIASKCLIWRACSPFTFIWSDLEEDSIKPSQHVMMEYCLKYCDPSWHEFLNIAGAWVGNMVLICDLKCGHEDFHLLE